VAKQKEIQKAVSKITQESSKVNDLTNVLELRMKKKDCLEIILRELIFQIDRFNIRTIEADKINAAVTQAQSLAAKKAKNARISGLRGSTLFATSGTNVSNTRYSRSFGLNRGSQYLDNSRNLSKHALNIASKINLKEI
jgi:hypothetical protein